jgi:tripartite-type tricarboxylate transporter receptor subunit TctC
MAFGLGIVDAHAQAYPVKPIRIIFGYTTGNSGDVSARLLAQKMAESLGQNVLVENRPGASGAIADEAVAKSPPDGYTLLYAAGAIAILPALRTKLPYDVERDLTPVSLVVTTTFALVVHPSVPARDVKSLIALAPSQKRRLTFGSPGVGSSAHFAGELFNMMGDAKMLHVPYKGPSEAAIGVVIGEVDIAFPSTAAALPLMNAGKLKALAVTSGKRVGAMPSVPTLGEAGVAGYERYGWNGVLVPAAVSKDIVARLNGVIVKAAATPEIREAFAKLGIEPHTGTPEQFGAFMRNELVQNAKVAKFAGIRIE